MLVPKLLADVWQFEPSVDQNRVAVAGFDEPAQVGVALGSALPIVPRGHVQRADAGGSPARGKVVGVRPQAVSRVEKSPQTRRAKRELQAQVARSLRKIGKPVVAMRTRRRGYAQECSRTTLEAGHERRLAPSLAREDSRIGRNLEHREIERLFPDDAQCGH